MKKVFLLALAGIAVLFFLLFEWVGMQDVAAALLSIDPVYLPLIVGLPFAMMFVYSVRWNLLLNSVGVDTSWRTVIKYAFIGAAFNNITPMVRFGGEPVKGYMIAKEISARKGDVFASMTTDSFVTATSLLVLIYFGAVGLLIFSMLNWFSLITLLSAIVLPAMFVFYVLFFNKRLLALSARKISGLVSRFSPEFGKEIPESVVNFRENIRDSLKRKDVMAASLLLGLTERMLEVLCFYLILLSMGIEMSLYSCAMVLGVGVLAGLIPLLPGGLVAYESSTMIILGLMRVSPATAATSIMLWRGVSYWLITGVGMGIGWFHGVKSTFKRYFDSGGAQRP